MPGPEAAKYVKMMNTGSDTCTTIIEKLCNLPTFFCPEINILNVSTQKTLGYYFDELAYFIRRGIVKALLKRVKVVFSLFVRAIMSSFGVERNCLSNGRVFSTMPINHVMESSYLAVCRNATYHQTADILSCTWKGNTLYMQSPYQCAEDINVNQLSGQLDC